MTAGFEVAKIPGGSARFRIVRDVAAVARQPLLGEHLDASYPKLAIDILRPRSAPRILPAISAGAVPSTATARTGTSWRRSLACSGGRHCGRLRRRGLKRTRERSGT